jgi:hypothetical protein
MLELPAMRAYPYLLLGVIAAACGGSAFNGSASDADDGGAAGAGDEPRAGAQSQGGAKPGKGGASTTAGFGNGGVGVSGSVNAGGDEAGGGVPAAGGESGAAGQGPDPEPADTACPALEPKAGGACKKGLRCSYGDDPRVSCRSVAQCDAGKWTVSPSQCKPLAACDVVIVGKECAADAAPCLLQDGVHCACKACRLPGPCSSEHAWECAGGSPGQGCAKVPPNEGQACASNLSCSYGSCALGDGVTAECNGGTWEWQSLICPL